MRVHPRTRIVVKAELEINDAVAQAIEKHDLTFVETQQILASIQLHWLKYALRHERHPGDPDMRGDEA